MAYAPRARVGNLPKMVAGANGKVGSGNTIKRRRRKMGRPSMGLSPTIGELKNHHRSMARDIVAMGEIRNRDLARIYNMTPAQISIIVNSPVFVAELARLEDMVEESICDVREGIRLLVPRAEQVIKQELFNDDKEDVNGEFIPLPLAERKMRLATAFEILDRDSGKKKHGESGAKELHFHQHNELHVAPRDMSTEDLQKDVFELIALGKDED
jgi:hypothetical protein